MWLAQAFAVAPAHLTRPPSCRLDRMLLRKRLVTLMHLNCCDPETCINCNALLDSNHLPDAAILEVRWRSAQTTRRVMHNTNAGGGCALCRVLATKEAVGEV
jgi:hypothetical protein